MAKGRSPQGSRHASSASPSGSRQSGSRPHSPRCPDSPYREYDWRPEGYLAKSLSRARREMCPPTESMARTSCPPESIVPAGKPSDPAGEITRGQFPCSAHLSSCRCVGKSSRPPSSRGSNPCDYRLCSASETYARRVSPPHSNACCDSCQEPTPRSACGCPVKFPCDLQDPARTPDMDPAGISTKNPEYPWPADFHTIIRLDSSLKHQGLYKHLGRIKGAPFGPRAGDIVIVKIPRAQLSKDCGYVAFYTHRHSASGFQLCPGDLLLRIGTFLADNVWRYKKRYRLYELTDERRWLLIGMVDNFVNLLPVVSHFHGSSDIDRHCKWFFPRRGDLVIQLRTADNASKLDWYSPRTKGSLRKGDILVRAYLGSLRNDVGHIVPEVEAQVEIFLYTGGGLSWVFMGRDECWLKDGNDIMPLAS